MAQPQDHGARYQLNKQGGPFELVQIPKPVPDEDEVVIKLKAAALNPVDYKILDYGILVDKWPTTLGLEGAGVVDVVGSKVKDFKQGDEVLAALVDVDMISDRKAAFQEYATVPFSQVAKKPAHMSFEEAASLPVGWLTAAAAISMGVGISIPFLDGGDVDGFMPKPILVLGGSSVVGAATIQMLRMISSEFVILATSSAKHHERLLSLGADRAFDYKSDGVNDQIRAATPEGKGVEAIIDAVNSVAENNSLLELLTGPKKFAEVATGRNVENVPADVDHKVIHGQLVFGVPGGENLFAALGKMLAEQKYKLPVDVKVVGHGLESVGKGLDELKKGVSGSKLVVIY